MAHAEETRLRLVREEQARGAEALKEATKTEMGLRKRLGEVGAVMSAYGGRGACVSTMQLVHCHTSSDWCGARARACVCVCVRVCAQVEAAHAAAMGEVREGYARERERLTELIDGMRLVMSNS